MTGTYQATCSSRKLSLLDQRLTSGDLLARSEPQLLPNAEERREELLERIVTSGSKSNILNTILNTSEQVELQELTRIKYQSMPCMQTALRRLDLAIDENFSPDEAKDLKLLTNHVIGYYLNIHQYHNAFHAVGMVLESLNICNILGIQDSQAYKIVIVAGLYHDTGNGQAPSAPDGELGDEVQAAQIFKNDLKTVRANLAAGQDLGALAALADLENQQIKYPLPIENKRYLNEQLVSTSLAEAITASITYTVFKDRFEDMEKSIFRNTYLRIILENFYETKELNTQHLANFLNLSESYFVWITKNADIAGSLEGSQGVQNCLLSYSEDQLRKGFKPGDKQNFDQYRAGFHRFLKGSFANPDSVMAKQAQEKTLCPFPTISSPNQELFYSPNGLEQLRLFFESRIQQEDLNFNRAKYAYGKILTAMFVIAAEEAKEGRNIADLPIKQLKIKLENWRNADIASVKEVLLESNIDTWKPAIKKLDYDLDHHPLLHLKEFESLTIADFSPAMFNRIFLPDIAEVRTFHEAESIVKMRKQNEISLETHPRDLSYLEEYFGELTEHQLDLIKKYQVLDAPTSARESSCKKVEITAWAEFRQAFPYHQIIQLAEANIIDPRIAGEHEEATCIQNTVFDIERKLDHPQIRPCLTGILNLLAHFPRSFRLLTFNSEEVLIKLGEKTRAVFILLEGDLTVNVNNREIPLEQGEMVGEMSVLSNAPAIATVFVPSGKSAQVAIVHEEDILTFYAASELRANLVRLARYRKGL